MGFLRCVIKKTIWGNGGVGVWGECVYYSCLGVCVCFNGDYYHDHHHHQYSHSWIELNVRGSAHGLGEGAIFTEASLYCSSLFVCYCLYFNVSLCARASVI